MSLENIIIVNIHERSISLFLFALMK